MPASPRHNPGRWLVFMALVVAAGVAGCGPRYGTITGTVTYKGTQLKGGNVTFVTSGNQTFVGSIGEDGKYSVERVPAGPAKVGVETSSLKVQARGPSYQPPPGADAPKMTDPKELMKRYTPIPAQYEDPTKSGLTYTVKGGSQTFDIKID